jgi:hypothetical protein
MAVSMRVLAATIVAAATVAPAALADPAPLLAAFQGCWHGQFGAGGPPGATDDRCIQPVWGGHFVRDTHRLGGGDYGGESLYRRVPDGGIEFTYYSSDGGVMRGAIEEQGETLVFAPSDFVTPEGQRLHMRATWRRVGADGFVTITEAEQNGAWREVMRINYLRAPAH